MRSGILLAAALAAATCGAQPKLRYPSPVEMAISSDGGTLYVVCEGTDELAVVDARSGSVTRRIAVGRVPKGIALAPDGRRAYVVNSWSDDVSEIDLASFKVVRTLHAGFEPTSAITDRRGAFLYTANRISNDVSVIDLKSGAEIKRLLAGRGASYLALSPDGTRIYSTHIYPNSGKFRTPSQSEITVIDTARQMVVDRYGLDKAAGIFHVALSRDGRLGVVAQLRPKNLVPLAHVEHGWVMGNTISVFGADAGELIQLPIDELERYFTPPFAVAIAPDKSAVYISTTGSDSVTVIDVGRLLKFIRSLTPAQRKTVANDLSASANYVESRIPVGLAPKGLALSPDGSRLYVATRNDDTISVVDTAARKVVRHRARRARNAYAGAARRALVLQRTLRFPGSFWMRELPPGSDFRRRVLGPRTGRLRQRYRGQPPARRYQGHGPV
jgi:YVTN family beta-propeller protein